MKKICLIVPCYLRPERTKRIIENVLNQTINNWEAFIIGDGCPEYEKLVENGLISSYIEKANENGNALHMFNLGKNYGGYGYKILDYAFENCNSEYIIFAGNDDILKPNHFEHYLSETDNYDLVAYPTYVAPHNYVRIPNFNYGGIGHSEIIVKADIVKDYKHNKIYGHDWDFIKYILNKTDNIKISTNQNYTYIVTHTPNNTIDIID